MITRIVKLSISSHHCDDFIAFFNEHKATINNFNGCIHVELLKEEESENIFFTYSHWENNQALENYRNSTIFESIWKKTKTFFNDRPEAWSLNKIDL